MLHKGDTLVIASHNQGKIREIQKLLDGFELKLISATDLNIPEPEETGLTFVENSILKATEIMKACQLPCLADDSGLCVDALEGAPGIYSARWAEKEDGTRDFNHAFHKIFSMLDPTKSYAAHMTCVLTLAFPEGSAHSFEGIVEGQISFPARGEYTFGYDPIFTPHGYSQTFAEMDRDLKSSLSHRRRAFDKLIHFLR
ncbi:RdgB/HAM1 family non-canonical purine NTP pyrophosphatase [Candidatus Odyssella acanthamoebae]|uniref:dITP/XTP pyrophosphatase n=1 Tax=Candidatus Odyssella acanthamoebae TaxID=91604 RepID=A0A077AX28_9PROT|nr:RdgB/HAM1 family non-canonical purine NTP pyrophosphatase [Candidatus Paracaedibacter acanthamoebae]AIK97136.1 nucleoside-triphosphate diphosphatase [Candidatus Paracaedibacter acanthamoebae]